MPPTHASSASGADDIEVLVTGFGPFGRFSENPSWLCTAPLHGIDLPLDSSLQHDATRLQRRVRIQSVMTPVVYRHVLDLVSRIHGNEPASPFAERWVDPRGPQPEDGQDSSAQGNGEPFPQGYRDLRVPVDAQGKRRPFDLVVHVGVGSRDHIALETIAHKRGYDKPDARSRLGPEISVDESNTAVEQNPQSPSAAEQRELENIGAPHHVNGNGAIDRTTLGFGKGYEPFAEKESMEGSGVTDTVQWLQDKCNFKYVRQSHDAGRYLCDFIFYCSLAERRRAQVDTFVQFIHVPPIGQPYSTEECTDIIRHAICRLAQYVIKDRT